MENISIDTFTHIKERMAAKFPALIDGYIKSGNGYISRINDGISADSKADLIDAAHSLKSASGLLGLVAVYNASETLEYAIKSATPPQNGEMQNMVQQVQNAFEEAENFLQEELAKA